jgi:hypothetical protein
MTGTLESHLASLGLADCCCPYEWRRSLGRLYGIGMGPGWVRTLTVRTCPHHGDEAQRQRAVRNAWPYIPPKGKAS